MSAPIQAAALMRRIADLPAMNALGYRWIEAGASETFVRGAVRQLAGLPVGLRERDRHLGTDTENRKRRTATAKRLRNLARALDRDPEATRLTILNLDDDEGLYRVEWLWGLHNRRPTIARVLVEAAELLETARGFGTVHLTSDTILGVAQILRERRAVIESVTGKRLTWRSPNKDIASIAGVLLGKRVTAAAVRKLIQRSRSGTKNS